MRSKILRTDVPDFTQFGKRRLKLSALIGRARHQHSLFAVPIPSKSKSGMRFWNHRPLEFRVLPGPAVVGGDFDLADGTRPGPGQPGDFVISVDVQLLSAGRARNYRIRT